MLELCGRASRCRWSLKNTARFFKFWDPEARMEPRTKGCGSSSPSLLFLSLHQLSSCPREVITRRSIWSCSRLSSFSLPHKTCGVFFISTMQNPPTGLDSHMLHAIPGQVQRQRGHTEHIISEQQCTDLKHSFIPHNSGCKAIVPQ